jgi:glycosyltransferase involved in cell wall biosynthesis
MASLKIIHTDTDDIENPLRGGQPVRTFEVNSRLTKRHQITVLTATYPNSQRCVERAGINYRRLGVTIPKWGLSSHLTFLNRLPNTIKKLPHDLIVEEFTPPFGFCNLQRFTKKPVVSIVQWHFFKSWEDRYHLPFENIMKKRALRYPERDIIVQTNKMGDYFKSIIPQSIIHKVPCGISIDALKLSKHQGDYALFLGRLDIHHKGLDDLLDAWKILIDKNLQIPLWIVGDGQDAQSLKNTVRQLGLGHLVHFKGRLENESKRTALANCRFLVMPSRQETFGITALEAMANGKPVVAYNIDHLNEVLRPEWSHLVELGDLQGFANYCQQLWENKQHASAMGLCGFEAAKKFTWEEIALLQERIYQQVVNRGIK